MYINLRRTCCSSRRPTGRDGYRPNQGRFIIIRFFGRPGSGGVDHRNDYRVGVVSFQELVVVRHVQVDATPSLVRVCASGWRVRACYAYQQAGGFIQQRVGVGDVERGFYGVETAGYGFAVRYSSVGDIRQCGGSYTGKGDFLLRAE